MQASISLRRLGRHGRQLPESRRSFSTEKAVEVMKLTKKQIEVTMFASEAGKLDVLTEKLIL